MSEASIWWVLAGAMVVIELLTGTIYLLLISLGLAAAALAAHLGLPTSAQIAVAAVVGGGSAVMWRAYKKANTAASGAPALPEVSLDVGEIVHVDEWSSDGTASAKYRGANWQVFLAPGEAGLPGTYRITEVTGNRLMVTKI